MPGPMDNLTGLGLLGETLSGVTGEPGQPLGGVSELDRSLTLAAQQRSELAAALQAEAGAQPSLGGTLKDIFTSKKALIPLAGGVLSGLTGGGKGLGEFSQGFLGGVSGSVDAQVEAQANRVKSLQTLIESQDKLRNSVFTLLGQQPEMFGNVDPQVLNQFFDTEDLQIDPATMLATKRADKGKELLAESFLDVMKLSDDPATQQFFANKIFETLGVDNMPEDLKFAIQNQKGALTDAQILTNFYNGKEMLQRKLAGASMAEILAIGRPIDKTPPVTAHRTMLDILNRASAKQAELTTGEGGSPISLADVVRLHMPERDRVLYEQALGESELSEAAIQREYMRAAMMTGMLGMFSPEIAGKSTEYFAQVFSSGLGYAQQFKAAQAADQAASDARTVIGKIRAERQAQGLPDLPPKALAKEAAARLHELNPALYPKPGE